MQLNLQIVLNFQNLFIFHTVFSLLALAASFFHSSLLVFNSLTTTHPYVRPRKPAAWSALDVLSTNNDDHMFNVHLAVGRGAVKKRWARAAAAAAHQAPRCKWMRKVRCEQHWSANSEVEHVSWASLVFMSINGTVALPHAFFLSFFYDTFLQIKHVELVERNIYAFLCAYSANFVDAASVTKDLRSSTKNRHFCSIIVVVLTRPTL